MTTTAILENEVFVGAGAGATMVPEMDIYLGPNCGAAYASGVSTLTIDSNFTDGTNSTLTLIPNLYVGCVAKLVDASGPTLRTQAVITENTATTLKFDENITNLGTTGVEATIMGLGAPAPAPAVVSGKPTLLSDNWLGLVNTITPPSVEVELGQLNLAVAGTRNFAYQFKKNETVSGGSLDVSMSNGMWLYYALGDFTASATNWTITGATTGGGTGVAFYDANDSFVRVIANEEYPPLPATGDNTVLSRDDYLMVTDDADGYFTYDFSENNGDTLPSFALDVSYEKAGLADAEYYLGSEGTSTDIEAAPYKDIYSRVFTGCQVNSLTMNFEEGQELKSSVDLVTRRAFDAPADYMPKRQVRTASSLFNYSSVDAENQPYLFSGGNLTLYGQTLARVKSGSLTISNNLTAQRFIGNYSRDITSVHIPAQRTYEISLTMLITDTKLWDNLRAQGEHTGTSGNTTAPYTGRLALKFSKSTTDYIELKFNDYITQSVSVPFPDDKGPIEVEVTLSARTLEDAKYVGRWKILHSHTGV